jgi:hypothetical protein
MYIVVVLWFILWLSVAGEVDCWNILNDAENAVDDNLSLGYLEDLDDAQMVDFFVVDHHNDSHLFSLSSTNCSIISYIEPNIESTHWKISHQL